MLTSYIRVALRNFVRDRLYSLINVLGLSIGLLCAIFVLLYIHHELSYDEHHANHERIFRLDGITKSTDGISASAWNARPLGPTITDEYAQIANFCRFYPGPMRGVYSGRPFHEESVYYADGTVFDIFTFKFLKGTPKSALSEPWTIVLTDSLARKYFGARNPIGETIQQKDYQGLTVSAVIEDIPKNSHLKYDALVSMDTLAVLYGRDVFEARTRFYFWSLTPIGYMLTYVLLNENATIESVIDNFDWFNEKYYGGLNRPDGTTFALEATPLADTHLRSGLDYDLPTGNIMHVYIFGTVAAFILLIAAFNHMSLATARADRRAKEIGVRKCLGASKTQIAVQLLIEAVAMALFAMLISVLLAEMLLPAFSRLMEKDIAFLSSGDGSIFLMILLMSIVIGFASGTYPSLYLARFAPAKIVQGSASSARGSAIFRRTLVLMQFSISICIIAGTLLVSEQHKYLNDSDLGFSKEGVIVVPIRDSELYNAADTFKAELLKSPAIAGVSMSSQIPGMPFRKFGFLVEQREGMKGTTLQFMNIDYDYLELMDIEIIEGRGFTRRMSTDGKTGFIVNEALVRKYGLGKNALGKRLYYINRPNSQEGEVIGVVKDFNFGSLHHPVDSLAIMLRDEWRYFISVRINPGKTAEAIEHAEKALKASGVSYPLDYFFLSDKLRENYWYEDKLSRILRYFAIICIMLSCLGLLGLSSYVAEQKTKEIGIRKVMGASVPNLLSLQSKSFIKLVLLSNLVACPIVYCSAAKWLENYPYKIDIGILPFLLSALFALLITMLTVGYQAYRAASANPVVSLRYE